MKEKFLFWGVLLTGVLAFIGSFFLSVDAILIASNPDVVLGCDFSANVSCTTVGSSWQAQVFGFPNAFLGLMFEPVVIFLSVIYLSGTELKNWILIALQGLFFASLSMAMWLFVQSAFVIHVLCPWCLVVCFSTIIMTFLFFRFVNINGVFGKGLQRFSKVYGEYALMLILLVVVSSTILVNYVL